MTETTELSQLIHPGAELFRVDPNDLVPGSSIVVVYSRGRFRTARVLRVGTKRAAVAYTTESGHTTKKAVPFSQVYSLAGAPPDSAGVVVARGAGNIGHDLEAA